MNAPVSKQEWLNQRRLATEAMPKLVEQVGLPAILLPYQQRAVSLLDSVSTRVLFIEKSRRIGLTWGLAAWASLKAAKRKSAGGMDVMYMSYSQEMTREFIDACAMWARAFGQAATEMSEFLFPDRDENGDKSIKAFRIGFASGFEIIALSSAPRSLRGKQGVVIIDEAAFVDNLAELLKAALAFLMWGGQVVVCSTHDGADNVFNQHVQDILAGRSKYSHMRIDFDEALKEGLYGRICLVTGKNWTPESEADWRQDIIDFYGEGADEELFCIPSLSSGSWLPAPLIEARMTVAGKKVLRLELPTDYLHRSDLDQKVLMQPFLEELEEELGLLDLTPLYAAGFDFARVADLSVFDLLAIEKMLKRTEALSIEMRNVPGTEQKLIVGMALEKVRERLVGAAFDATGMGWTVAEDMGRKFGLREEEDGSGLIMAVKFSETWYRLEMPPLKTAFEDDLLALIPDADHLTDLRAVKVVRGIPRVPELRTTEKGDGSKAGRKRHGDHAIALALAHYASRLRWVEYDYRGAPDARRSHIPGQLSMRPHHYDGRRGWWTGPLGAGLRGSV